MAEYIDREALFAEFDRLGLGEHSIVEKVFSDGVRTIIAEMPAADVAPVVHGHWDKNGRCTACGGHAPFWCMASTYYKSPFCHECGAKMDEEVRG